MLRNTSLDGAPLRKNPSSLAASSCVHGAPNGFRVQRERALLASRADTCAGVGAYVLLTGGTTMLCTIVKL